MKMAKASQADLDMAMELVSAFENLGSRWVPAMPMEIEQVSDEQEHEGFDRDDDTQCGRALRYLLDLTDRASLGRVVWGMAVVCDKDNQLLDPDADTIEVHPGLVPAVPPLMPELASILGMICFQCIPYANMLRLSGHEIKNRAEDEQAAVIHWMLGHYFSHGEDGWRKAAAEDVDRMRAETVAEKGGAA